ncbi:MAG: 2-oxoacid:ferredoxin oxidoreductase subunit beta, partial [Gammaproteobacteria bacterium]|nr:2-oxoacid:ferredoxin oxidoreductase subunit beta [Gammaproteobacteria bacterium]
YGTSWVGQSYAGDPRHLSQMITQAIAHRGFSYLHILSPCVTFDKTSKTYTNLKAQVRLLPDDHDSSDKMAAMKFAMDADNPPIGLFYRESRPTLSDNLDLIVESARGRGARATI